jgi:predicted phage terminase large subunit-like protein
MKAIRKKRRDMGPDVWATQMMCNPKGARKDTFKEEWIKHFNPTALFNDNTLYKGMNVYIFMDPAGKLSRKRDFTAIWVLGLGSDHNFYWLDLIRDKMNLTMKKRKIFELHRKYHPKEVMYEQVGMQSDIEAIEEDMERNNYRFNITPIGANIPKNLRIEATQPLFAQGRMYFPDQIIHENWEGINEDMLASFIEQEYKTFPVGQHDDAFDSLSMVTNKNCTDLLIFPDPISEQSRIEEYYREKRGSKKPKLYNPLSAVL